MRTLATKQPTHWDSANQKPVGVIPRSIARSLSTVSSGAIILQHPLACACGGGCPRCQDVSRIQTKLTISEPGDQYEQEADRIADEIIEMPEPLAPESIGVLQHSQSFHLQQLHNDRDEKLNRQFPIMTKGLSGQSCKSAPSTDHEEEEEEQPVMGKTCWGELHRPNEHFETQLSHSLSQGDPLTDKVRSFMEPRFGQDFSDVRIHTGAHAVQMARELNAEAFTSGRDIYFNVGRYSPETTEGKKLLAHELTHVIQQTTGTYPGAFISRNMAGGNKIIQCYRLNGFPTAEEAAMHAAIPKAIATVKACSNLSWWGKWVIPIAIRTKRYDYKENLGLCGWTFPASWYIEIGKEAFNPNQCCDLASTIAHEAAHTEWYTEGRARRMECNCFGCSC